jgi:hypothetical protein
MHPPRTLRPSRCAQSFLEAPDGAVDYLNIVENGVDFVPNMARIQTASSHGGRLNTEIIVIANWRILPLFLVGMDPGHALHLCDGSYVDSSGKEDNDCLLYGANDHRGVSSSIVTWVADRESLKLKHGLVILRLESWHMHLGEQRKGGHVKQCLRVQARRLESPCEPQTSLPS